MTKASSKSDQTKALIMRAAILVFTERGFEGSTLRDIANEAGSNMGLIRYYFGNKADLYRDTLAYIAEPYNSACLQALSEAQNAKASLEELLYAWLAAPYTHWSDDALVTGEELLCFLNKMAYESQELTHEVYESHYSFALQQWQEAMEEALPQMQRADWLWCLTCLRGMYFNIVAHNDFTLWSLPVISNKQLALRRLAADTAHLLQSYQSNKS